MKDINKNGEAHSPLFGLSRGYLYAKEKSYAPSAVSGSFFNL